ncbi:MAG: LPS assembly protein LptD [Paracoccaceae bacterium]
MMRRVLAVLIGVWVLLAPAAAAAQGYATLVADRVSVSGGSTLVADGHVEVLFEGRRLKASRVRYDKSTDKLEIEGPIVLDDGQGAVLLADAASLSGDMREGLLQSARLVLNQQLQLAANQVFRTAGRYTRLDNTVASSCQVCASRPVPLWEIRAAQIVHDQEERQLYFDRAQFRIAGVPVFYIPRLRMPDPTLKRATGFLAPEMRSSSLLGTGLKLPYFIAIGDHADLTLTPYLSSSRTATVELRYRQAFRTGQVEINGAVSRDDLIPGTLRGYVFADGSFTLPRNFTLNFDLELTRDPAYLSDYGYSQKDRLTSGLDVTRTRRNEYIQARILNVHSIRAGETNATLPTLIGDFTYHRRFKPPVLGGEGGFRFQMNGHRRASSLAVDGPDADSETDGRDLLRASARLDWRRNWIVGPGIVVSALGELAADIYAIRQDDAYPGSVARVTPTLAAELRWPWLRSEANGVSHVVEPFVQLAYSPRNTAAIPNDDSALVEFDEGNLLALSRFAGADRVETGTRAAIGAVWTRHDPAGWSLGVTAGRILRRDALGQFTTASGLTGTHSDWLTAVQLKTAGGLSLLNRAVIDDSLSVTSNELRLGWANERLNLGSSYLWLLTDAAAGRPSDTSEWTMDAAYRLGDFWTGKVAWRYDFTARRAASAGVGLQYSNECVAVDLSLSRRFTSSTSVRPTTDIGLSVDLIGFGDKGKTGGARRSCAR